MNIKEFSFDSATGVCTIHGNKYTPENVKAVVVIHHGMAEHIERYINFVEFLTSNGFAVYMYDMANHGKSNVDYNLTGYFGRADGYKGLVADFNTEVKMAQQDYPDKKIVVMGHSMGSFVVRCFTAWYSNAGINGAIYMGTGGPNPIASVGDKLSSFIAKTTGYTKKVKLLDTMTFGKYNDKTEKRTAYDWLTRDTNIVDKYIADDYCGFLFSAQGMNDLVKLNISANSDDWYKRVPKDLPILLTSGAMDPVGEYSKGINTIADGLKSSNHTNLTVKLYDDCRHEILNELNKDEVYNDILNWLNTQVLQ
jgi:alpha-beta hydrolase superfamily lysophospholipase